MRSGAAKAPGAVAGATPKKRYMVEETSESEDSILDIEKELKQIDRPSSRSKSRLDRDRDRERERSGRGRPRAVLEERRDDDKRSRSQRRPRAVLEE